MATLFNECTTGVAVEPVPCADLVEEGKTVFADGQHLDAASGCFRLLDQRRDRRHVAVLHRHPHGRRIGRLESLQLGNILGIGEERLFDEKRQRALAANFFHLWYMAVVRASNQDAVQFVHFQQFRNGIGKSRKRRKSCCRFRHSGVRLEDHRYFGVRQECDIAQVLLPHHPTANDTISYLCRHSVLHARWHFSSTYFKRCT